MTKMMDLFRHRSNSASSEADKRKAVCSLSSIYILFNSNVILMQIPNISITESNINVATSVSYTKYVFIFI